MTEQEAIELLNQEEIPMVLNGKNNEPLIEAKIMAADALEKQMNDRWIPVTEKLPDCEKEVWIQTKRGTRTTAIYEDGKMSQDDSVWNWTDIDFDYDEKTDTNYIPEGWWEYRHFNPDDVYNCCLDEEVIAWKPLPEPYKGENNGE